MEDFGTCVPSTWNLTKAKWRLLCGYWQMEPPAVLVSLAKELANGRLTAAVQSIILNDVLENEVSCKYPPDSAYKARVLKALIGAAEEDVKAGRQQQQQLTAGLTSGRERREAGRRESSGDRAQRAGDSRVEDEEKRSEQERKEEGDGEDEEEGSQVAGAQVGRKVELNQLGDGQVSGDADPGFKGSEEEEEEEVLEGLYSALCEAMVGTTSQPGRGPASNDVPGWCYRTYAYAVPPYPSETAASSAKLTHGNSREADTGNIRPPARTSGSTSGNNFAAECAEPASMAPGIGGDPRSSPAGNPTFVCTGEEEVPPGSTSLAGACGANSPSSLPMKRESAHGQPPGSTPLLDGKREDSEEPAGAVGTRCVGQNGRSNGVWEMREGKGGDLWRLLSLRLSLNILQGSTGCHVWPASFHLAAVLLSRPHLVGGKICLELGSGSGLVGVCLARLPAVKVILTDGNAETLDNLVYNMRINGVPISDAARPDVSAVSKSGLSAVPSDSDSLCLASNGGLPRGKLGVGSGAIPTAHVDNSRFSTQNGCTAKEDEACTRRGLHLGEGHQAKDEIRRPAGTPPLVWCQQLDWESVSRDELQTYRANLVLGADLVYDPTVVPSLVRVLAGLLHRQDQSSNEIVPSVSHDPSPNSGMTGGSGPLSAPAGCSPARAPADPSGQANERETVGMEGEGKGTFQTSKTSCYGCASTPTSRVARSVGLAEPTAPIPSQSRWLRDASLPRHHDDVIVSNNADESLQGGRSRLADSSLRVYGPRDTESVGGEVPKPRGAAVALIATAVRNEETLDLFLTEARNAGLDVKDLTESVVPRESIWVENSTRGGPIRLHRLRNKVR